VSLHSAIHSRSFVQTSHIALLASVMIRRSTSYCWRGVLFFRPPPDSAPDGAFPFSLGGIRLALADPLNSGPVSLYPTGRVFAVYPIGRALRYWSTPEVIRCTVLRALLWCGKYKFPYWPNCPLLYSPSPGSRYSVAQKNRRIPALSKPSKPNKGGPQSFIAK